MEIKRGDEVVVAPTAISPEVTANGKTVSRRQLLKVVGVGGFGAAVGLALTTGAVGKVVAQDTEPTWQVYAANATGMVVALSSRCVGCRRCELACTEFNDGKASPTTSRIKVDRNYNFGPEGGEWGFHRGEGRWGNHRIAQDTCRQCPHPVPCQLVCPVGAIEVVPPVNARVVNEDKCIGCQFCQQACPWEMTSFDKEKGKSTKCHLCEGDPKCVEICPVGALQYVPWEDKTRDIPTRHVVPAYMSSPEGVQKTCVQCHG